MQRKPAREANYGSNNFSLTQPNLSQSIGQIVNRIQSGQSVPQTEMPIYLGDTFKEMIGFENLTKLEQIDFAREYRKKAQDAYDDADKKTKELNAQKAAENAANAILQKQQAQAQNPL